MELKKRIEQVLSEILSDKYECEIMLHFEARPKKIENSNNEKEQILC